MKTIGTVLIVSLALLLIVIAEGASRRMEAVKRCADVGGVYRGDECVSIDQ